MSADALGIPRGWPSIDLPGYREHAASFATYSVFEYAALPPIDRDLDDSLSWLLAEQPVEHSLAGGHVYAGEPVRPATGAELDALIEGLGVRLPLAFANFIRGTGARHRIRSCTACYLDLGNFPVSVADEGWLVHFLSDQQWVRHWFLHVDRDGAEAVVSTYSPYGFRIDDPEEEPEWATDFDPAASHQFRPAATGSMVCAESFSEFLYRFWIENEIWYALNEPHELTTEQLRYAEHYRPDDRRPSVLDS